MTAYFLDSSALVKRYVVETGTAWVQSITDLNQGNLILIAQITNVEIVSAIMRRHREGSISIRTAKAIRLLLDRHSNRDYSVVTLHTAVVNLAEDLLETYPLRAYDVVQLASALESNRRLTATVSSATPYIFVTADTRLLSIAQLTGLQVDNPNNYP
jgi:predicted nucleic acid-binding protein